MLVCLLNKPRSHRAQTEKIKEAVPSKRIDIFFVSGRQLLYVVERLAATKIYDRSWSYRRACLTPNNRTQILYEYNGNHVMHKHVTLVLQIRERERRRIKTRFIRAVTARTIHTRGRRYDSEEAKHDIVKLQLHRPTITE